MNQKRLISSLVVIGIGGAAYWEISGKYRFKYPPEVRGPLLRALREKNKAAQDPSTILSSLNNFDEAVYNARKSDLKKESKEYTGLLIEYADYIQSSGHAFPEFDKVTSGLYQEAISAMVYQPAKVSDLTEYNRWIYSENLRDIYQNEAIRRLDYSQITRMAGICFKMGQYFDSKSQYEEAISSYNLAINALILKYNEPHSSKANNEIQYDDYFIANVGPCMEALAQSYTDLRRYQNAIMTHMSLLKLISSRVDTYRCRRAFIYNQLSNIAVELSDIEMASKFIRHAISEAEDGKSGDSFKFFEKKYRYEDKQLCEQCWPVLKKNLKVIKEMGQQ